MERSSPFCECAISRVILAMAPEVLALDMVMRSAAERGTGWD
jgi:hypothetical protein